jgi:hypothetical protein
MRLCKIGTMPSKNIAAPTPPSPKSQTTPARLNLENPLVFISHDSRDADLAEVFGNLLMDASGGTLRL